VKSFFVAHCSPVPQKTMVFGILQLSPLCHCCRSIMYLKISTEIRWNNEDRRKQLLRENTFQHNFAQQKSYVDLPEIDPRNLRWEAGTNRLNLDTLFRLRFCDYTRQLLMLFNVTITRNINTLCGQNLGFLSRMLCVQWPLVLGS
jgi:hypothetical protein